MRQENCEVIVDLLEEVLLAILSAVLKGAPLLKATDLSALGKVTGLSERTTEDV